MCTCARRCTTRWHAPSAPTPISLRTIAGDVSSNGTVAEAAYIKAEAKVGGEVPVAAVGGDHDSTRTWQQMVDDGIELPDLDTIDVDGTFGSRAPTTGSTRRSSASS